MYRIEVIYKNEAYDNTYREGYMDAVNYYNSLVSRLTPESDVTHIALYDGDVLVLKKKGVNITLM